MRRSTVKKPKYLTATVTAAIVFAVVLFLYLFPNVRQFLSQYIPYLEPPRETTDITGGMDVHFIDVGQGDATLILTADGDAALIDTGTSDSREYLVTYIQDLNVTSLDYLILTHPHADHIGGAAAILDAFAVEAVLMPDVTTNTKTFLNVLQKIDDEGCGVIVPEMNQVFSLGDARFTCLGPVENYGNDELNDMSLVFRLDYGTTAFLFSGDAEKKSEKDMLDSLPMSSFSADVMKLGHHGSSTSNTDAFLNAISPSYAVASCGLNNEYGHPHTEILSALKKKSITLLRTDKNGSIVFTSDGDKVTLIRPEETP
ncbi:MAG: MBL fold metallo-hydrolase, partial [Clostridia bacterium]|nr:MBL fold metallo-hydrolase [Clostridia bacterium]